MQPYMFLDWWLGLLSLCTMEQHYPVHYQLGKKHEYWFVSDGRRKVIKCVRFSLVDLSAQLYNLSLVDWQYETNSFTDKIVTNNGDTIKVLQTVAFSMQCFFDRFPHSTVYFTGNSPSRNRLYKMQINNHRNLWENEYCIIVILNSQNEIGFYCKKK